MTSKLYTIYQTRYEEDPVVVFKMHNEEEAQDTADMLNATLAERGVPSWVSSCYVAWGYYEKSSPHP